MRKQLLFNFGNGMTNGMTKTEVFTTPKSIIVKGCNYYECYHIKEVLINLGVTKVNEEEKKKAIEKIKKELAEAGERYKDVIMALEDIFHGVKPYRSKYPGNYR